jgi:hypothetical protein
MECIHWNTIVDRKKGFTEFMNLTDNYKSDEYGREVVMESALVYLNAK